MIFNDRRKLSEQQNMADALGWEHHYTGVSWKKDIKSNKTGPKAGYQQPVFRGQGHVKIVGK